MSIYPVLQTLKRPLRWLTIFTIVSVLFIGSIVYGAYAVVERSLIRFGESTMRFPRATNQNDPSELDLNGAKVMLDNGATEDSVHQVLDYFQAKCREVVPTLDASWIGVNPTAKQDNTSMGIPLWDGVFRIETKNKGVIACLDMGTKTISTSDLLARIRTFLATGEISVIGDLRYTMATKGQYKTVFVNLWTEGPINIKEMFPQSGDAPGRDFPGVPRPTGLRRVLSVSRQGNLPSINVYLTTTWTTDQLKEQYQRQLNETGWTQASDKANDKRDFWIGHRDERRLNIGFATDRGQSVAVVTMHNSDQLGDE